MLRVGGGQQQMPPMDPSMGQQPQDMPMDGMPPMDPQMMGGDPTQDQNGMPPMDNMSQDNNQSQFDTNFDAGVEADEDTDPKKYIQQLTGKLSTTLNSYNSENADDEGLNKYVAKMIVKASTKNMDDAQKKEIIKAINTSATSTSEDETEPEEGGEEEQIDVNVEDNMQPQDDMAMQPMQEGKRVYKKKDLKLLSEKIRKNMK